MPGKKFGISLVSGALFGLALGYVLSSSMFSRIHQTSNLVVDWFNEEGRETIERRLAFNTAGRIDIINSDSSGMYFRVTDADGFSPSILAYSVAQYGAPKTWNSISNPERIEGSVDFKHTEPLMPGTYIAEFAYWDGAGRLSLASRTFEYLGVINVSGNF